MRCDACSSVSTRVRVELSHDVTRQLVLFPRTLARVTAGGGVARAMGTDALALDTEEHTVIQ